MPKALEVNWDEIQKEYQSGEKSLREVAEQFGVSYYAVERRAARYVWNDGKTAIIREVTQKVSERLSEKYGNEAEKWIEGTKKQALLFRSKVKKSLGNKEVTPKNLLALVHVEKTADDIARRAFGLADTPQVLALSSDSPEFQGQVLSQLEAVRKLVSGGKVDPKTIDVEAIVELTKEIEGS